MKRHRTALRKPALVLAGSLLIQLVSAAPLPNAWQITAWLIGPAKAWWSASMGFRSQPRVQERVLQPAILENIRPQ